MKRSIIVLSAVLCLGVFAVGCGNKKETKEPVKEEKRIEYMTIGNEKDATYDIIFKNTTGKSITAVSVKGSSETEYPVNMMKENEIWKNDEMVELYYTPVAVDGQEEIMWSMQLICDDETVLEVTSLDFNSLSKEVSVCYDESVPITYVEYKDKEGNQVSTKEQEITAKEEAEAAAAQAQAEAEAAAAAQAQAEAEAAAAAEAAKQQQYTNNSGYSGAAPSQNADNCLGGDALTY